MDEPDIEVFQDLNVTGPTARFAAFRDHILTHLYLPWSHARIEEDLFTTRLFADFELEWDWKISPAGNSGIKNALCDAR